MKYIIGKREPREWTEEEEKLIEEAIFFVQLPPDNNTYNKIALFLSKATQAEYVVIGLTVIEENKQFIRTLAHIQKQTILDNTTYSTLYTPCEHVLGHNFVYYPEQLQELFPLDDYLREIGVHSYMAIALNDREDNSVGLLSLLHKEKMAHPELAEHLLFMMAPILEDILDL